VIALCADKAAPIEAAFREAGFPAFSTEIHASLTPGARP